MNNVENISNLEKMIAVGKILYGDNWQSPLSRALGVSDRTIRNYVAGETQVPVGVSCRLLSVINEEIGKLNAAIAVIENDKINDPESVNIKLITEIVDRHAYENEQYRLAAIDAVNNSIGEDAFLSDLDAVAIKFSI
ncbi:hypothetical protein D0525_16325 [Salmonella enterica]|uniref:hypothetical protein n=1 Tax=Salmonella enterica TaxID=28901 RepID=UPI0010108972|nr:hypothetical protein [Salmonella enterica]EJH7012886.1 hypothetical protein [Salmonella enterica]EJH7438247.1 hypothetical protein [Salmonella enterica]EJH7877541.1 hypothetical protein [Salmonella enterica]EJI6710255.1 hypothetical protein [Salmonella enterica]RXO38236.1 hypothetical protein D0525_16325 [Salmonella enterica]